MTFARLIDPNAKVTIEFENELWNLTGVGLVRGDEIFCHLSHTTKGRDCRNGRHPIQICVFVELDKVREFVTFS